MPRQERGLLESADPIGRMVDSLRGPIERAARLTFKQTPRSATRSREQVKRTLSGNSMRSCRRRSSPAFRWHTASSACCRIRLELRSVLLDLCTERVAGYYDPDSATLFGVAGADPLRLRVVVAHELVHALQGQYVALDSLLHQERSNDRLAGGASGARGQAAYVSIGVLVLPKDQEIDSKFWALYRDQIREQQTAMPVFSRAPVILRESLIFPYLAGAEFIRWWGTSAYKDTLPFGRHMPAVDRADSLSGPLCTR